MPPDPPTFPPALNDPRPPARRARDLRLDVFRGLAMVIILIAHVPNNVWALWIPARFGWSDATEMFVFCSGLASALAFGRRYEREGWRAGSLRVGRRMVQVYGAHLILFAGVVALVVLLTALDLTGRDYVGALNLYPVLIESTAWQVWENRLSLFILTYVPNYLDILPMYLVVLALLPIVMALADRSRWLALAFVLGLWAGAQMGLLWMPAEPWTDREWFFNPFGWQLLFFTGFAFGLGWLRPPAPSVWIVGLCLAIVLLSIPGAYFRLHQTMEWAQAWRDLLLPFAQKTDFGVLRYVHFLAAACLALWLAGEVGARLAKLWAPLRELLRAIGQQALITFVASMILAQLLGFMLDLTGRSVATVAIVNLIGIAALYGIARIARWWKGKTPTPRSNPSAAAPPV